METATKSIKNLSQLKKALKEGVKFEILNAIKKENIGQIRVVNIASSVGIYTKVYNNPSSNISLANRGKGCFLGWDKATNWTFQDDLISLYLNKNHEKLIIAFKIVD